MKIGLRTPSLKKSFKARTTGAFKRKLKKATNPLYGKKGMGLLKNPKKAMYNKVYRKTTVGVRSLFSSNKRRKPSSKNQKNYGKLNNEFETIKPKERKPIVWKKWHAYAFAVLSLCAIIYYIKDGKGLLISLLSGLAGGAIFTYLLARFTND